MKILVLNGSPRKGNTLAAINAFAEGAKLNNEVEIVDTYKLKIKPCLACDRCGCTDGCVLKDDSDIITRKMMDADMIIFASPVYWWGISAQLKLVIDKMYGRSEKLKKKQVGVIIVGAATLDDPEYELIHGQFKCIAGNLKWKIRFFKAYSAYETKDLAGDAKAMKELAAAGKRIK